MCDNKEKENKKEYKNIYEMMRSHILTDNQFATKYCVDITYEWLEYYNDAEYLGCETNKIGDSVVALYHNNTIYLLGDVYKTIMYAPKIMFHFVDNDHLHIDDVLMKDNNVGNGSIAMRALLKYAQKHDVKIITGLLSSIDDDHIARRNHYYEKFGFNITKNKVIKHLKGNCNV